MEENSPVLWNIIDILSVGVEDQEKDSFLTSVCAFCLWGWDVSLEACRDDWNKLAYGATKTKRMAFVQDGCGLYIYLKEVHLETQKELSEMFQIRRTRVKNCRLTDFLLWQWLKNSQLIHGRDVRSVSPCWSQQKSGVFIWKMKIAVQREKVGEEFSWEKGVAFFPSKFLLFKLSV